MYSNYRCVIIKYTVLINLVTSCVCQINPYNKVQKIGEGAVTQLYGLNTAFYPIKYIRA